MEFFVFMVLLIFGVLWLVGAATSVHRPSCQGSFKVTAYKNNEIVFMKTVENDTFTIKPGKKWDRVEITET